MQGKTIKELNIGDFETFTKTVSESDVYLFAGITGDLNPAHINEVYARNTFFKERIAHGILVSGFVSTVLGMYLPGPGTIYLGQELKFLAPVKIGDTITAKAEVVTIISDKNIVKLRTTCENQDGKIVIEGLATVKPPK